MTHAAFQTFLKNTGRYAGAIDGLYGPMEQAAALQLFTDGPDTVLTDVDYKAAAFELGATFAQVKAVAITESRAAGVSNGRPLILPERHVFWRELSDLVIMKGVRVYKSTPLRDKAEAQGLAYQKWGAKPYPNTQTLAYDMLLRMVQIEPEDALKSASWGKFQIMGNNFATCGFTDVFSFVQAMSKDERTQLDAFVKFLQANGGKGAKLLRQCGLTAESCQGFAAFYNGSSYAENSYDHKIAANVRAFS